ncbi:MAG TPA: DUF2795 domain-containing protein [Pilimelia sp.]|nr:DUF2795 domain-containing protein [Pilimelia sp.]
MDQFAAVQKALEDIDFPATKDQVVAHAERHGDATAVHLLRALPLATYRSIAEIRSSVRLPSSAG